MTRYTDTTPAWYTSLNGQRAALILGATVVATAHHLEARWWSWETHGASGTAKRRGLAMQAAREAWEQARDRQGAEGEEG